MREKGIILSQNLKDALLATGYREGMIHHKGPLAPNFETINDHLVEEVLSTLLLHGKLHIQAAEIKKNHIFQDVNSSYTYDAKEMTEMGLLSLTKSMKSIETTRFNTKISDFEIQKELILSNIQNLKNIGAEGFKKHEECFDLTLDIMKEFQEAEENLFLENLGKKYEPPVLFTQEEFAYRHPKFDDELHNIVNSYRDLKFLTSTSKSLKLPVKTTFKSRFDHIDSKKNTKVDNAYRLYQIILEEDCTFPYPRTLSSTIKILNDSRILVFRELLSNWVEKILEEDIKEELYFRKEIRKAKKDLAKVSGNKRLGKIISFVSLPVGVASAMMGMPVGLILAPIGPVIILKNANLEKKNKWLLLGKS